MTAQTVAPFDIPDNGGGVPALPSGFVLDDHPTDYTVPAGFKPDPVEDSGMTSGWRDSETAQPLTKLSDADTATLEGLYRTGSPSTIKSFIADHGFQYDSDGIDKFVKARDQAIATGQPVDYSASVAFPKVHTGAGGAAIRGAGQGATLGLSDEIHGAGAGLASALTGGSYTDAYDRTVDTDRSLLAADEDEHALPALAGNLAGSLLLPLGLEKSGITASTRAVGLAARDAAIAEGIEPAAANRIAARAITHRLAAEGAAYGGAYGAGSSNGDAGQRLVSGLEGAGEGLATGIGLGALGGRIASKADVAPVANDGQQVAAAAARQGVDLLPADVGGPTVKRLTAAAAQAPLSASPVIKAAQSMTDQSQAARDRIASAIGSALDPEGAGLAVRGGAQKYIASSGQDVRNAYRAAEMATGDAKVTPTKALDVLDRNIAELSDTPGGAPGLDTMQSLRDELAKGDVSPAGLLRMRTTLRDQFMQSGLRGSDTERRIGQVLDAAGQDVSDGLQAAGKPEASAAYARAAAMYKQRIDTIDNVLKPIIGSKDAPRSGEQITKTIMSDLQGNNARAVKLLRSLSAEDQATARASVIGSLGNVSAGSQNAAGDAFSLPQFLTQWNKIGNTAKRAFFSDESRSALDDLAKVADATKQAQKYANFSNTSGGIWGNLGILASGAVASPHAAIAGGAAQLIGGRLLASPRFARWLARAPRTALGQAAYVDRLSRIAKAEPAIANQVTQLQSSLENMASQPSLAAQNYDSSRNGARDESKSYKNDASYNSPPVNPLVQGNINLHNRPRVYNADGSISTVRSMSFGTRDGEVLVPTVSDDGRIMSDNEAMQQYYRTGRQLGIFKTPADADRYAVWLHNQQAAEYR